MTKIGKLAVETLAGALLLFGSTNAAMATNNAEEPSNVPLDGVIQVPANATQTELENLIDDALEELDGKQLRASIDALRELPFTYFLADAATGEYLAAVHLEQPAVSTMAISWNPYGCPPLNGDTPLCLRNTSNGIIAGYNGTGIRHVTHYGVKNVTSGSYTGSVTSTANQIFVLNAWQGVSISSPITSKTIARG